jgi:hypothetical protein
LSPLLGRLEKGVDDIPTPQDAERPRTGALGRTLDSRRDR